MGKVKCPDCKGTGQREMNFHNDRLKDYLYYQDDAGEIYCGDCLEIMPLLADKSVDLVLTDPPYGIDYKKWDKIDFIPYCEKWIYECFRSMKDNGSLWSFMSYENILDFIPILKKYGIVHLENWVIWARQKGRGSSKHLKSQREDILHVSKSRVFVWNNIKILREVATGYTENGKPRGWFINENGERVRWTGIGNVWVYTSPFWASKLDNQKHPAQKPVAMIERLIRLSSNETDLILDPFLGSGTTAVACKRLNRKFIGIEISEKYCEIAKNRL